MSKFKPDALFVFIKSLTKAEKRHVQLAQGRPKDKKPPLYLQLFQALDKMEFYDEKKIIRAMPQIKRNQLSNLKGSLYNHILESLRWLSRQKDIRINIRQQIDYAQVLYNKGLYQQSLRLLGKAKAKAIKYDEIELKMHVVGFEKKIEGRHITRSIENRAEELSEEATKSIRQLTSLNHFSNLSLNMYGMYLKMGHVRNEKEALMLRTFFENQLFSGDFNNVKQSSGKTVLSVKNRTFYEKVNLYQAYSWYAYILQDFLLFYRYTQKWVDLFTLHPIHKETNPALYLKAINNLLTAHFFNQNHDKFCSTLDALELFRDTHQNIFDENTKTLAFVHLYTSKINKYFLEGTFEDGLSIVPELLKGIEEHKLHMDRHRVLVFYYKIACLYFGSGNNTKAIMYLNKIINLKIDNLRADIQCFARILHLIAHYEQKHYDLTEYLLPSVYNFLEKNKELSAVLEEILHFMKRFNRFGIRGLRSGFINLKKRLKDVAQDPYERRFFLYLDVISWLESKIDNRPVQEVIREKFEHKEPRI